MAEWQEWRNGRENGRMAEIGIQNDTYVLFMVHTDDTNDTNDDDTLIIYNSRQVDRACGTGISQKLFVIFCNTNTTCRLQSHKSQATESRCLCNSSTSRNKNNGRNGGMAERMAYRMADGMAEMATCVLFMVHTDDTNTNTKDTFLL